jgi:putative ABC transport system permease protein
LPAISWGTLIQDVRFAIRMLRKNLGFTVAAVVTLALGIGGNTAIFTVTSALLLRPLPLHDPQQLVVINLKRREGAKETTNSCCTLARFEEIPDRTQSFSGVAAVTNDSLNLTGHGEPEQVPIARVSPSFFHVLGIGPHLGRTFTDDEGRADAKPVVLISDSLWHTRFGGSPDVVGQTINLDAAPQTIIGVLPPNIHLPFIAPAEVWSARYFELSLLTPQHIRSGVGYLTVVARLKLGVSLQSATAEMDVLDRQYKEENPKAPDAGPNTSVLVDRLQELIVADIRTRLIVLSAAVGVLLLIACANVAGLLLSRALARRKEIAIRAALGAGRAVIIGQLLTESVLLSLIGGICGLELAWIATRMLATSSAHTLLPEIPISLDWRVLAFSFATSIATGLIFGAVPALQLSQTDVNSTLRDEGRGSAGSRGRTQIKGVLVVSQVALSMVLLTAAGLLVRSFVRLLDVSPGFDFENVLTMNISLPTVKYGDAQKQTAFFDELLRCVSALPGVRAAGTSAALPLSRIRITPILAEGQPEVPLAERPFTIIEAVSPGFLGTMRIPLRAGRAFSAADNQQSSRVVIVNEALARRYWPNENPVGKHIAVGRQAPAEVIGVAGNAKNNGLALDADPQIYLPFAQLPWGNMNLFVRTATEPRSLIGALREQVSAIDPDQPVTRIQTVEDLMNSSRSQPRFTTLLLGIFSVTALVLAIVGIYGVVAYSAAQRRQEMGIRMALGAARSDILRLVVRQGLVLAGLGTAIGLVVAFALSYLMATLLYQVGAHDLGTFAFTSLGFLLIATVASYLPARHATRVDPAEALRNG